jgi:hypothetical protein
MGRTAIKRQIERYETANVEAALIVLRDPVRYEGAIHDWALALAYRLTTADPKRYPELTNEWAAVSYQRAFCSPDPSRDGFPGTNRDELAELRAWNRR